ncbi:MAG: class beta-lactamase-related serine hydrolase, partial [Glaciihabitans sp.]|nr:class beta-lactamase-related serine hydrolase [Glaciihabitans sp.]
TNYLLLGLIIEKLEAKSLGDVFQDRFFGPLGMTETSFPDALDASLPEPHPLGYMFGTNTGTIETAKLTEAELAEIAAGTLTPNNYTTVNPSWAGAAGAAISTANDMVTWAQALAGDALLSPELQSERMLSTKPRAEPPVPGDAQYGLGIARFGQMYGHTGELPGFSSFVGNDPVNDVTLVVWTNLAPTPFGSDPAAIIARKLLDRVYAPGVVPAN